MKSVKSTSNEVSWWIDPTGSTHTNRPPTDPAREALAMGKVYPESRSGVITHISNKPAEIAMVSQQLLDVLHHAFPGTRWWVKDPVPAPRVQTRSQAAS